MAPINPEREQARREAAKKRRQLNKTENKENIYGLASVTAQKIHTTDENEEDGRKINHIVTWIQNVNMARDAIETHWKQPWDWRFVTEKTLHNYIPFEKNINLAQAMDHITNNLQRYDKKSTVITTPDEDTPLWNMSRNAIRRALYKASIRRRVANDSTHLPSVQLLPR